MGKCRATRTLNNFWICCVIFSINFQVFPQFFCVLKKRSSDLKKKKVVGPKKKKVVGPKKKKKERSSDLKKKKGRRLPRSVDTLNEVSFLFPTKWPPCFAVGIG